MRLEACLKAGRGSRSRRRERCIGQPAATPARSGQLRRRGPLQPGRSRGARSSRSAGKRRRATGARVRAALSRAGQRPAGARAPHAQARPRGRCRSRYSRGEGAGSIRSSGFSRARWLPGCPFRRPRVRRKDRRGEPTKAEAGGCEELREFISNRVCGWATVRFDPAMRARRHSNTAHQRGQDLPAASSPSTMLVRPARPICYAAPSVH